MSEEFDSGSEQRFSSFIPLTIALCGFIAWFFFQDYELNKQRSALNAQLQQALPTISEAENMNQRYLKLITDLDATAKNDDAAKAILNDMFKQGLISEAIRAGLIHVQQNGATNGAPAAPAAPATTGT